VHVTLIPKLESTLGDEEIAEWDRLLRWRDAVMTVLEAARASKAIGQSLEADITMYGDVKTNIDLAKLFIVSHVDVRPAKGEDLVIEWSPARGKKCGRCWQYREEVGEEGALCARCQKVVDTLAPPDQPTV
jgi:isoleucyl-tRNA synthetase